jgi:hypothetical protein
MEMIVLTASMRRNDGVTRHYLAERDEHGKLEAKAIQSSSSLAIDVRDDGVFLLHLDEKGECVADTWHQSIEEAKEQARFEFLVQDGDWKEVGDD